MEAFAVAIQSVITYLKVVILGNRTEIATLGELEEDLYSLADYAEIESYYSISPQAMRRISLLK